MLKPCALTVRRTVRVTPVNPVETWNVDLPQGKGGWLYKDYSVVTTYTPSQEFRDTLIAEGVSETEEERYVLNAFFENYPLDGAFIAEVLPEAKPEDTQSITIDGRELYKPTMNFNIEDTELVLRLDDNDERNLEFWQVLRIPIPVLKMWLEAAESANVSSSELRVD